MPGTTSERALTYLGFRPPTLDQLGAPRSSLERIGVPAADSSPGEIVLGIAFLAVLVVAWVFLLVSDMSLALRILGGVALVIDLLMIGARVRYLLGPRA